MALLHPLDGHLFGAGQPCFGCGPEHPHGFRLRFAEDGPDIVTRFTPDDRYQGPPGIMHGGLVSTLADEVAAWAVLGKLGKFGFTASFDVKLHQPVRIGAEVEGRSFITRDLRRIADVGVRLVQNGQDALTGSFRFVILDQGGAERLLGRPIPETWKSFCR